MRLTKFEFLTGLIAYYIYYLSLDVTGPGLD